MNEIFADLHVHIGRSENGKPIKITAARSLNFANIAKECAERKGISVVGIIDCASPYVIEDIENFLATGEAYEIEDGGMVSIDYDDYTEILDENANDRRWNLCIIVIVNRNHSTIFIPIIPCFEEFYFL